MKKKKTIKRDRVKLYYINFSRNKAYFIPTTIPINLQLYTYI